MMRVFAWIAGSVAVASAQVTPGGKEAGGTPVSVEASAAIRKSLADCREPRVREVLPDPVKYPDLHAKQMKSAQEVYMLGKTAEYPFYDVDLGFDGDSIQPILDTLSAPGSLRATAARERFWPETMISWGKGDQVRWAALSIKTREVVFSDEKQPMRYSLTGEAVKRLKDSAAGSQNMRPDALEEAVPLLDALKQAAKITIHEGVPRFGSRASHEEALKRRGEWLIDGFQFLKSGTVDHDTKTLRDLLLKEGALITWRGGKACGGFHPDFAITWKVAERDVSLLVCFTCHEVLIVDSAGSLLYDLPDESYQAVKAELEKFRPVPVKGPHEK